MTLLLYICVGWSVVINELCSGLGIKQYARWCVRGGDGVLLIMAVEVVVVSE